MNDVKTVSLPVSVVKSLCSVFASEAFGSALPETANELKEYGIVTEEQYENAGLWSLWRELHSGRDFSEEDAW